MTWALGCLLAAGTVLTASPWLWPRGERGRRPAHRPGDWLTERLARAGLGRVPVPVFVIVSILTAVVLAATTHLVFGVTALSAAAALFGVALPTAAVVWRQNRRRAVNDALWPDVIDHLVSAVRAGVALPDALVALAQTGPDALRADFAEFARDYRATASFSGSIDRLKDALADPVADRIIETLRMAREVGGTDVTGVLRSLSAYLREDVAIRSEVSARQSWVRNAARLGVAAPWIILLLLATRPEAALAYNSPGGTVLVLIGAGISVVAYRVMVALGRLPRERRWFR